MTSAEEHSLPTEIPSWRFTVDGMIEGHTRKLWERVSRHIQNRQHDDNEKFQRKIRELEGQLEEMRDREPGFHMGDYHHHKGPNQSWQNWIMGIVGTLIVLGIGGMISVLIDIKADQKATLSRLEEHEKRLDRLEAHSVYRASP